MKTIQVPIEEELLKTIDEKAQSRFKNRSDFIRKACQQLIKNLEEQEKENTYAKGYQKTPEKVKVAEVSAKLASSVLKREDW
ncbi:MAG: ribbon-helix-helix domain-containing protein [Candidatus Ratteibacteria bacterium]|nr:ribbon-helix-helix domain-containing protein [Candidatus Ratteibacteria bacterium]